MSSPKQVTESKIFKEELFKNLARTELNSISTNGYQEYKSLVNEYEQQVDVPSGGWFLKEVIENGMFDCETGLFSILGTDRLVSFEETIKMEIINPNSVNVVDPTTKTIIPVIKSLEKNILDSTGHYNDEKNGTKVSMKKGIGQKLILLEDRMEVDALIEKRKLNITASSKEVFHETERLGTHEKPGETKLLFSEITSFPKVSTSDKMVSTTGNEIIRIASDIYYDPTSGKVINSTTGKSSDVVTAVKSKEVESNQLRVKDINTGNTLVYEEAIDIGLINEETNEYVNYKTGESILISEAMKNGLVYFLTSNVVVDSKDDQIVVPMIIEENQEHLKSIHHDKLETGKSQVISSKDSSSKLNLDNDNKENQFKSENVTPKTREFVEPRFEVTFGKAKSVESPKQAAVLQKIRKKSVKPKEAVKQGLVDETTGEVLNDLGNLKSSDGKQLSLKEAVKSNLIDGNMGAVIDPKRNVKLTIQEALDLEILDPENGNIMLPVGRSLTLPETATQGLIQPESLKIIHPEIGTVLTIQDAIICDIINPFATVSEPQSRSKITLEEAMNKGIVDSITAEIHLPTGTISIVDATKDMLDFYFPPSETSKMPLLGLTFPVALQHKLIDTKTKQFTHPVTNEQLYIGDAIDAGLIMTLPILPLADSINVIEALDKNLIDPISLTMIHPKSGQNIPINNAVESGLLQITAYPFIKPLTFRQAFEKNLLNLSECKYTDEKTGELMLISEAIVKGCLISDDSKFKGKYSLSESFNLLYDDKHNMFRNPQTSEIVMFENLLRENLIDLDCMIYNTSTGEIMTTLKALENGKIDIKTLNYIDFDPYKKVPIKDALKMGTIAVIDLSGLAITETMKVSNGLQNRVISPNHLEEVPSKLQLFAPSLIGQHINLRKLIELQIINPQKCLLVLQKENKKLTVDEALKNGIAVLDDVVKVYSFTELILIRSQILQERNAIIELLDQGFYNKSSSVFVNPQTGEMISFCELVSSGILNAEKIEVKNLQSGQFIPLLEAFHKLIIDRKTGQMTDPNTGEKVTFIEAVALGWIKASEESKEVTPFIKSLTLQKAIENKLFDTDIVTFKHPITGEFMEFFEALKAGFIDMTSIDVYDPKLKDLLTLKESIDSGLVDLTNNIYINPITSQELTLETAFKKGLIVIHRHPFSLEAIIRNNCYNPNTGMIEDPITKQSHNIDNAVKKGLVDAFMTEIKDTKADNIISLDEALETHLIISKSGKLKDTAKNSQYTLDVALEKGLIMTNQIQLTLLDAINKGLYNPSTGLFLNPATGEAITLAESIKIGFIDGDSAKVKNVKQRNLVTLEKAILTGLLDAKQGLLKYPQVMTLDIALLKGFLVTTRQPWSLQEALEHQLYNTETGLMIDYVNGKKITLEECILQGYINKNALTVKDPRSDNILTLLESIQVGIIDPKLGIAIDPRHGSEMNFYDAVDRGLILSAKRRYSLPEAIYKGFYDSETGLFINPSSQEKMSTEKAIRSGLIDPNSTLVINESDGTLLTFNQAVKQNIIDTVDGKFISNRMGKKFNFQDAFDRGLLIDLRRPLSLKDALLKGLHDERNGKFLNPDTGEYITLKEALEINLIDAESVHVKDTKSGFLKKISLFTAIENGMINNETGKLVLQDKTEVSLPIAFDLGLIIESRMAISLQKAIKQGLYIEETGKFTDPNTGQNITLHEAVRRFVINPSLPCYWDPLSERILLLVETIRAGIIDRREGTFQEPNSNQCIPLNVALERGFIIDIENPFSLCEAVTVGLYNPVNGKLVHPTNGRYLTLEEAILENVIDLKTSYVKNKQTNRYMLLSAAIDSKLIDAELGKYIVPNSSQMQSFNEAVQEGLIIKCKKPMDIDEVFKMKLFDVTTGKFIDPEIGDKLDLSQAIEQGLIEPSTASVRNAFTGQLQSIRSAIEDGIINVSSGTIIDERNDKTISLLQAYESGLIIKTEKPVSFQQALKHGSIDFSKGTFKDPKTMIEYTLEEAIKNELIDPESAVIKDPTTGRFKTLKNAIKENIIDIKRKVMIHPFHGKAQSLTIMFDQGTLIFLHEPLSFDQAIEKGFLNTITGQFKNQELNEPLSLKEAIVLGYIDSDTVLVKDTKSRKILKFPEAFDLNIIDPEKGTVLNAVTNQLLTINDALSNGLILTFKRPLTLLEALEYKLYNSQTGLFLNPYNELTLTFQKAIASNLIDPTTTRIRDAHSGEIMTIHQALESGLLDGEAGCLINSHTRKRINLLHALRDGLLIAAEKRIAVEEKYKLCGDSISRLFSWVENTELQLADLGLVKETTEELHHQINNAKALRDDIEEHQKPILICLDQVSQVIEQGQELLSKEEIYQLQKDSDLLKRRYDALCIQSEKLLRRLSAALDELHKFSAELHSFSIWLTEANTLLIDNERSLGDLQHLRHNANAYKTFASDVIAHQADLRFITMAAQKFLDESKDYLRGLNDFRINLPHRLHHIEPIESDIKMKVQDITTTYHNLLNRVNKLSDKFAGLTSKQFHYLECSEKAINWLSDVQKTARTLLEEPVAAEPKAVQDQVDRLKALSTDVIGQARLIENTKQASKVLLDSLEGVSVNYSDKKAIEDTVSNLEKGYSQLMSAINDKSNELQTALVHSQDVQDGLDRILRWLDEAENIQRNQSKSISLVREKLDDQIQDHRMLQTDIDRHKPTIDALNVSSQDLLNNSNSRLAKKVEMKMKDVNSRFEKLCDKSRKRGEILDEVSSSLETFEMKVFKFEEWLCSMMSFIDGRDITHRSVDSFERIIEDVMNQRNSKINEYEETVKMGKTLLAKIDVTDTSYVRDKLKHLEQQWKELSDALLDKQKLEKARLEQLSAYEALRAKVIEWLSNMEARVENLEPVAMDKDTLRKQALEIKPLIKEHAEYASTIDKVNQLGNAYDSIMRADSPHRARSPTKKQSPSPSSPTRRSPSRIWRSPDSKTIATTPLSSGSSGFGSRPNSVDNLGNLEDLTPIQQQLSEINHRYSLLGVKLSDRHQEVTDVTEEIRIHLDMLKALLSFIQAKEKQIPKDMLPLSRDLAERQMVELKIIQEEIQEKQHDMDRVKNQANDLLRKKPNALGASNLQQEVNELGSKWSQIQSLIKNKLNFLQELKEFQETNDLLINWLSQKEKMFHVLGPIASDPRMVTSQMQQVQVMRDEFISQQPLLNRFKKSGQNILKSIDSISPGYKKIKEQMDSVQSQWDDLINRLNNRERSLDAASGATKNFHDNLNKLQDSLQQISDKFDMLSETGSDSGEQLEKLKNLEDDLDKQRPLLADAESVCEQLCDILSDSASKNEITTKLNSLEKQYNNLSRKITNRKAELESSLREDKEFFISCDHIQVWLKEKENILNQNFQISADETILKHQVQEFEVTYKEVLNKEHEVHLMLSRGADMMNKMNRKSDTLQLQNKLDSIKHQWDKIRKSATDRHTRLQHCSENCRKYYAALKVFIPWLQQSEDKLNSLKPISFKRVELDKQIKEIQAFKNDISKHSQEFDSLYHFGESVISCCDIDKEPVREGINQIKKRWDRMNQGIYERAQSLDDISQNLVDYQEKARDVQHALQRLEDKLASHDGLGGASRDPKLLDRIKTMLSDANALKKQLDQLHVYADKLISNAKSKSDTSHILDEIEALEKRHRKLTQNLENRCDDLKSASEIVSHFTDKVKSVQHDLSDIEEKLDNMSPIARDIRAVTAQINEMKDFFRILGKIEEDFVDAEHQGHTIVSQGFVPDPKGCKDQLANLQRQLKRINERAKTRQNNLETMSKRLEQFYKNYNETTQNLNDAIHKEKSFSAVGGEIEMVKIQQEEFKIFQGYCMDEFNREVDEINQTGQSLIQSAAPGVKTNNLEQDLEKLNDKWNSLKEKLYDRERRLDVALLQSGKFQEALAGVEKWLQDTEDMVANQKPPSADYKVVKAQLQEQKFLNKLLLDRQGSMSSLMTMGTEVMRNLQPYEQAQVEGQLKNLMHRFEDLITGAQERTDALERTIPVAHDFQEKLIPLAEWLEQTEKRLATMATVPIEREKLRQRIAEHGALHDDIMDHKEAFEELTELAQMLMSLVGDDEAQTVVERLQEITDHYAKIVEQSEHIGQLLSEAHEGIGSFLINFEDLMAWIDEMVSRLSRYQILSVYVEKLQEQLDELIELSEEIADHQKQVSEAVNSGQEMMKHASGDDVIRMKEKLDMLQVKFSDLTSKATDRLRQAQETLPVVQNFHSSHERLISWMNEAEKDLKTLETVGLRVQESTISRLETEIQEYRPLIETINHLGPQLCQMSPGDGATVIEGLISHDNRRFDTICEQVQRKAERIDLSKQRNVEVIGDIDEILDWFHEAEKQMLEAEPLIVDPDSLAALLKEQKILNDEVSSQKGRVRDILASAKKLMRESSSDDLAHIRDKADELKDVVNTVSALSADRLSALEQALPLAEHFFETHADISQWLDEMESEAELLETPALNAHQIKKLQDRNKGLLQSVNEHKPLLDKLNKTAIALKKLCSADEGDKVQAILDLDNNRYNSLKMALREWQDALDEALQATSQFSDKLDGMLNALSSTAEQLNNAEPISAHPEKIHEQICDNKAVLKDLDKRSSALEAVRRAADDVITKAGDSEEPAVRDIKKKLDRLSDLWDTIQKAARTRGRSLEDAMIAAEKFWDELNAVMKALTELQDNLNSQEPPAVEPNAIQQQKEVLQEIKQEIEQTKPEVDHCRLAGQGLMKLCGEPDKPEVKKHIEDLDSAWENVTSLYAKREQNLINAMEKAMNFHGILQNLLEFLDSAEEKFSDLGPLEQDIETVKEQINELKDFKQEVDPHMIEVEALNRQAQELMERTSPTQARTIREPLADINHRWDDLLKGIVDRQRELENALLRLGQFQHALDELLVWMSKTEKTLDDLRPVFGDPQIIEVELAKHKVLMNDIQAHQTSVDTLNRAGRQLIEANRGSEDASVTQNKLNNLNKKWQQLQDKSTERQNELEEALKEAQAFHQEVQDLLMWLSDIDGQLVTSKPVGGLPETAREQLNRFMELYNDLDGNRHKIEAVMQQGQDYLKRSNEGAATNLQHNLKTLKQRWDNVLNRANDRKIKLEIALREATEFHEALQEFVEWLTNAEKYMSNLKAVSRVMDAVMEQIEEHKAFQKDVGTHREVMLNLDKKGTHLKYFSQKQDVILIKNLLISVQHRWERVVSKAAERTRALDHGYKEAKEFHDAWVELTTWLDEAESNLDSITHIGNDPEKIKQLLAKHKEFQRALGSKQPNYDATMKNGRTLKEKAPKTDIPVLQDMMDELKNKWNNVCSKSVDRQQKLEEALLFSGQFKDAVQALIDWLDKAQTTLSEEQFLYGDLDTVMALVDQHKTFQDELNIRGNSMESVRRTARELLQSASVEDAEHIQSQMTLLDEKWEEVVQLSTNKKLLLEESLKQAERLHKAVHMLLEWLSDAEMKLRFAGPLPEDEETTRQQLSEHHCFMEEMTEQEVHKDNTISLAQEILQKCHPDGVSVIRHWITIIQSRWEEVFVWARQREQRLQDHLRSLRDIMDLLEELLAWLIGAEASLTALEAEPLPDDIPTLEQLIKDHQGFMDDMSKKQPDVERVTKAFSSKRQPHQQNQAPTREKGAKELPHKAGKGLLAPKTSTPGRQAVDPEIKHPKARELVEKWRNVWLLAMERQRRLQDKYNYLQELERIKNFDFDEWRKRFLAWMNNKKSRVMDLFRKIDRDNDGKVTREQFIEGILKSKFPTSRLEMERVAEIFDRNNDGFVDHKEYIDTLRPDREGRPETEAEKIQDEVQRQVAKCTCVHRFKVYQVGEGKYRFGDSQKLRLVRILRSTVMVRVGGGWVALDEFLVKNDPCRAPFLLLRCLPVQSLEPSFYRPVPSEEGSRIPVYCWVREKSERSVPMRQRRTSGPADTSSDYSGPSFSETDSFSARSARARATPTSNSRLTPGGPSSKSSSRAGSRPSSRPNSRPPSRAGSDLSAESVEAYRSSSRTPTGTARRRTPVTPRSASNARGGTPTATSKIPSIKRTPSFGSSSARSRTTDEDGRPIGRERWK
ncbi:microtubule-actin cross-linking factor 1 isoform X2 [Centruroides vittatus]|uniref:microtubule-actin cross-linking factor 1 isoform X2 n=1 Tax=Centruroides vittatus TaxID=120091 RepID=UPI00350F7E18